MWSCHILKGNVRRHPFCLFQGQKRQLQVKTKSHSGLIASEGVLAEAKNICKQWCSLKCCYSGKSMQVQRLEVLICFEARGACMVRLKPIECTRCCCFFVVNHRRLKRLTLNRCYYEGEIIHACTIKPLHSGQWAEGSGLVICLIDWLIS